MKTLLLLVFTGLAAASCAVYVPTVPTTPLLRQKGEMEITAGTRSFASLEAGAAWVPVGRLLVAGEAAFKPASDSKTNNSIYRDYHRQAGLGLGTFWLLGRNQTSYLAAIGGVGLAASQVYDPSVDVAVILLPFPPLGTPKQGSLYQARYRRYYGQLYWAAQQERSSFGFSVRGTLVDYYKLHRDQLPISTANRFFLEPTCFLRYGRGPIQGQVTLGISVAPGADSSSPDRNNLTPISTLIGVGVVVKPSLWFQRSNETVLLK
ncbi:hypothetical protein [Hymenobacter actinosclerus]|uniref:Outer membrane protein beta-barrel domain-containing protein n=1 Tax=Hymenobacter actinosclerus TaxID=82805 RepID=A0A1I0A5F6_9BACT|nr:hypothetical protein [Hymenobacter actinosclerus]SES89404.1 hypothetical protein SAMN04487998_0598 [Hymenobacter actinosclerus]